MARELRVQDAQCSIAQAAAVVGDWWSLLVVREVARGHRRFDELFGELGISRKVLTERLRHLVEHGVLAREPYQVGPVRHEYVLTDAGWALAPLLISMQDWADRWLLGDGSLTGLAEPASTEAARVHALLGTRVPAPLTLPAHGRTSGGSDGEAESGGRAGGSDGEAERGGRAGGAAVAEDTSDRGAASRTRAAPALDVVADAAATVLFCYPATGVPAPLPPGWDQVPGAVGCTLENRLFRDRASEFAAMGVAVHGVSTQRPDEQAVFAAAEDIPFALLSDMDLRLAAALRLPTFRAGQALRLKRAILVIDRHRVIRHVTFPVLDIPQAVEESLRAARSLLH
ncbi:winged helix-turn-helix transcriptional regulator [Nonomuraea sp. NPDC047897]|uniref:winged helix-turn-helix transcriptional regulator n=1 Tax=Nonomuraea sp. NPDC047897 TaxID=3364346 RepID=UPI0037101682